MVTTFASVPSAIREGVRDATDVVSTASTESLRESANVRWGDTSLLNVTTEESLRLVSQFWVPLATIVPVIGVAYILEARTIASTWTYERRWRAFVQGLFIFTGGAMLIYLEGVALLNIVTRDFTLGNVTSAGVSLMIVVAVVVGYPTVHVWTIALNPLLTVSVWAAMSPLVWFGRRRGQKAAVEVENLAEDATRLLEETEVAIIAEEAHVAAWSDLLEATGNLDPTKTAIIQTQLDERNESLANLRRKRDLEIKLISEVRLKQEELSQIMRRMADDFSRERANRDAKAELEQSVKRLRRMR